MCRPIEHPELALWVSARVITYSDLRAGCVKRTDRFFQTRKIKRTKRGWKSAELPMHTRDVGLVSFLAMIRD